MDAISYLREDLRWSHEFLALVMQDATPEQAHWHPPGTANPLGATYAHAVIAEDYLVHRVLMERPALFEDEWKGKTGFSNPQMIAEFEWGRELEVDLPSAREYAQAVFQAAESYLDTVSEDDLDRVLDLSEQGFGKKSIAELLSRNIISHTHNLIGEASVLKGIQGAKGYPW